MKTLAVFIAVSVTALGIPALTFGQGGCSTDVDCMCTVEPERAWLLDQGISEHEIQADQNMYDSEFCQEYRAGKDQLTKVKEYK